MACALHKFVCTDVQEDPIAALIKNPFHNRCEDEKFEIIRNGCPVAGLNAFLKPGKMGKNDAYNKSPKSDYDNHWYESYDWLGSSAVSQKLYCWPCFLMASGSDRDNGWVKGEQVDLATLPETLKIHSVSPQHYVNCKLYADIEEAAEQQIADLFLNMFSGSSSQGEVCLKNRLIIKKLVEVGLWMIRYDLMVYFLAGGITSEKFQALFELVSHNNTDLMKHCKKLESSYTKLLRLFLPYLLNYLRAKILFLCFGDVMTKKHRPLCSIQMDSLKDIIGEDNMQYEIRMSIIVRYVNPKGIVKQHMLGLCDNNERTATKMMENLQLVTKKFYPKVISQSYDGLCLRVGDLIQVNQRYKALAPSALLIPSFDHPLSRVLLQGTSDITGAELFLETIDYLEANPLILQTLARLAKDDDNATSSKRTVHFKFSSEYLSYLLTRRESFVQVFRTMSHKVSMSPEMSFKICRVICVLDDFGFVFLLIAFKNILQITEPLACVFEAQLSNTDLCMTTVKNSIDKLKLMKQQSNDFINDAKVLTGIKNVDTKSFNDLFNNMIDNIVENLDARYVNLKEYEFLQLVDSQKFQLYSKVFPENAFGSLMAVYGKHFKKDELRKQLLTSIYTNEQYYNLSVPEIVKRLVDTGMKPVVKQAYKLFCIVATLPISKIKNESCLQRIHDYVKECEKHSIEVNRYQNHRSLPVIGIPTIMSNYAHVFVEKPVIDHLVLQPSVIDELIDSLHMELFVNKNGLNVISNYPPHSSFW